MEAKGLEQLAKVKLSSRTSGTGTFIATSINEENDVSYREIQGDLGEPFDPSYLDEFKQEDDDYLWDGEIGYCKKLNTLTRYIRKAGMKGEWDMRSGQFTLTRIKERNKVTATGRKSKKMEVYFKQDAFMWVDDDTHEYVVDIYYGDGSKELYRGTHVKEAIETALDWQSFNI